MQLLNVEGSALEELVGLKAHNVIAWAGASLRAKAQVTGPKKSPALKGRHSSRALPIIGLTVSPLQGSGVIASSTWASARGARFSPGYNIAGFQP